MRAVRDRKRRMVSGWNEVYLENYRKTGAEVIFGTGRFIAPKILEALAEQLGVKGRVEFMGFLTRDLLQTAVQQIAVVLMPFICEETAGLAAMEQMMRGKLVIASNIGGLGEVVDDGGLRFPAGNLEALTECMRTALDNPEMVERKGEAAKYRALKYFSQQRMVKEHVELHAQLLRPDGDTGHRTAA